MGELAKDRGGMRLHVDRLGEDAIVRWEDRWRGPQHEDVRATCGDVLLGRAQRPTYQLAVVTDDIAMKITDVVRGEDLLGSTARQILLYRALGAEPPRFAHHPLLVDESGRKLSKRDGSISMDNHRAAGRAPGEVLALLGRGLGLVSHQVRTMAPSDWIDLLANDVLGWASGPLPEVLS